MITLAPDILDDLARAIHDAYPHEACGLLIGQWDEAYSTCRIDRIAESANLAEDPQHRFEVDPRLQLALQKELRNGPQHVVGVYHSHPDGAPAPSETDRARAYDRDLVWLIAAVGPAGMGDIRAYRPGDPGQPFQDIDLQTST
jgi:proteasome lid subunit RPN8/RPN11